MRQKYVSEFIGTLFLVSTIIGSGIMAERLSGGNDGLALLGNTIATGAILFVLITIFVPISGAHFNPVVSFVTFLQGEGTKNQFALYVLFQILGGICGTFLAHMMFEVPVLQLSENMRSGLSQYLSEMVEVLGWF